MSERKFKQFFEGHFHAMVRYAYRFLPDIQEAEDVVQDAFIRLYHTCEDLDDTERARTFLYTIIRNLCISHLRHQSIKERYEQESLEEASPMMEEEIHSEIIYQETLRLLYVAVNRLPKQSRKIILLGLEGKTNQEIAEELGISVNTVKTLKKNA